jgi:predicted nuclease of predicted toxin-antitoxin system
MHHVGELQMSQSSDQAIVDYARSTDSIVVTLDADFHNLLVLARASGPSVVRIRIQGLKADGAAKVILETQSGRGGACGRRSRYSDAKVCRVRRLPVAGGA